MALYYCPNCFKKQQEINRLQDRVRHLEGRLKLRQRQAQEGPFGSSTPSSKVPIKPSALPERQARKGGGRVGHVGHGRRRVEAAAADRVEEVAGPCQCPQCGQGLEPKDVRERTALDAHPVKVERIVYRLERKQCPHCGAVVQAAAPGLMPKSQYGNGLLSHLAVQHYLYGVTLGQLERQMGVGYGSLVDALHQLSRRLEPVLPKLVAAYRRAPVRHADETGWRTDGGNGYAWLFCTPNLSLYRFRSTRSASVPREVLGKRRLRGVLVVDRYAGYNQSPCAIQYCYAHLLRDLEDLEKEFPDQPEVRGFVQAVRPLLAAAMGLRGEGLSRQAFGRRAADLRRKLKRAMNAPAGHLGVRAYQDLFRQNAHRLYHWADDSQVPAENNLAERELRPLVVARKVSFGSQSQNGAHTREVLMTVLHTLRKQTDNPAQAFRAALDHLAACPTAHPFEILFPRPP
jgi:transposase